MTGGKDLRRYAVHILSAIDHINEDTADLDFESFRLNRRARQLVERNLEIISEASRRVPEKLRSLHPEIKWQQIAGIGNVLRHDNHQSHPRILWETCRRDLGPLRVAVADILERIDTDGSINHRPGP